MIRIDGNAASLQIFSGTREIATDTTLRFLGHPPNVSFSPGILGRVFGGTGLPID